MLFQFKLVVSLLSNFLLGVYTYDRTNIKIYVIFSPRRNLSSLSLFSNIFKKKNQFSRRIPCINSFFIPIRQYRKISPYQEVLATSGIYFDKIWTILNYWSVRIWEKVFNNAKRDFYMRFNKSKEGTVVCCEFGKIPTIFL